MAAILADENVESAVVATLREQGYNVLYIAEIDPSITDDMVLEKANELEALLITSDKDFGELVFRNRQYSHGVLLYRLNGKSDVEKADILLDVLQARFAAIQGHFAVLKENNLRIRKILF